MKNFNLNFIHLCDDALFSQDGKLSLIGIFEIINFPKIPGNLNQAYLVFNIDVLNKNIYKIYLDIIIKSAVNEKEIFRLPKLSPNIVRKPNFDVARIGITLLLSNIRFMTAGKYYIEIIANKEIIGTLEFEVRLQESPDINYL